MWKQLFFLCLVLTCQGVVTFTVSGLSSGGFMAHQMHLAHSASITGAAIVAGGPYACTLGSRVRSQTACTQNPWMINPQQLIQLAKNSYIAGNIDNPQNLTTQSVVIFSGSIDVLVTPGVVQATQAVYANWVNPSKLVTIYDIPANHAWVTVNEGNPCWYLGSPYVNNCGYDLSGVIFQNLYANVVAKGTYLPGNMFSFEQAVYVDIWQAGMSNRGWIYIPTACQASPAGCQLHVNYHGCEQYYDLIGNQYVSQIGMNEWAESNKVIVMYPQTTAGLMNPSGCWDFWGYTTANFYVQSAPQILAVWTMAQNYVTIATTAVKG